MKVKMLSSINEFESAIEKGISLVDFNAPWCAPCRAQDPIIEQLAIRFEGKVLVAKLNINENREIAMKLGIQSIPALIIFKNGKEIQRLVGLQSEDTLSDALYQNLKKGS